ncbi:uncharacterized protein tasor2 isoform X2 [Thunnus albacares]|uniref:uncharacterized protein tasor2 isoform X2 n=1 Tax=Thunnus albacares TaxID=8236 RepID=UPI001CF689CE|nr:uncharacterized protein tasor2 isoform X2 [Thunnus albacares]
MESGTDGASTEGVFIPVSESSDDFQNNILAPLQSAYLYDESKQSFRYKSAVLIKNSALEEKYNAFRAKRREIGYSEEDLEENYGFLLFDDINKAKALGETGVLTGNSTCTTLGDPLKGVYISMYSDCLDLNRWYHGKSGYIAIIRLTKGRVKKVLENYTQNLTAPTRGFDCHMSEQLPSVSAKTSSFLAFERTQYYMYELLHDGSNEAAQSPSLACPFAIVSFSYTDTKASLLAPQEKSEEKKQVSHYVPWRGQLQIGTQFYDVGLRSTAGAMIPAKLPPVVKVDRAISMSDLRRFLPRAVFETCFSGEVFLDSLYCILFELVSSVVEETSSLSVLLQEIKEKDLALTIPLNDGGFLILLHSSHFLTYDDTGSSAAEVLQGLFVFPDSRVIQRDTKLGQKKAFMSSEILRVLPVLSYAEGEVEKIPIDSSEDLCDVLAQHMQSYAALINPGLALSPSREASIFPDQYDVPDAHKHLYSSPEWTNRAWQSFRSYLNKPASFQLPVSKASEILTAGQEERREDLDDDVYICLSSPEEVPASPVSMGSEDQLAGQKSPANIEPSVDSCLTSAEAQVNLTDVSQDVVPNDLQAGDATKDTEKSDLTELIKTDDMGAKTILTPPTSDDLPAELIVSITSAERTVTDESLSVISTVSATKHNDFQLPAFSTAKLQTAGVNTLNDETVKTKSVLDCPQVTIPTKTRRRKLRRGHSKARKKASKARVETPSLQAVKIPEEIDDLKSQKDDKATEPLGQSQLNEPPKIDWRKLPRHKRKFIKLSPKHRMLRSATVGLAVAVEKETDSGKQTLDSTILMELDTCSLRKKTERWDLKPVISECGRILVPHGSVDFADQIKSLKDKLQSTKDAQIPEEILVDVPANAHNTVEMEQESSIALETAVDETEVTKSKDGGNHLQNIVSHVNPEHSILRQLNDGNGSLTLNSESSELSSKKDSIETPPSKAAQEKHTDRISPTKGEFLLSKLKSVLLRGKRKTDLISDEKTAGLPKEPEPCLKKSKGDSDREMLKSTDAITGVQTTNVGVKEVSKMLSVDPLFAYALGLTPKERPDKVKKTEEQDTQLRKDTSETKEQTISEKQPQIIQRPPSIFPRRGRIKTLKKHQDIPAEYIKKKWWLHFQTPACYTSEKLKNKECTRDNSVRKTVKEKMHTACSSTDALNLLADLALGASNDQVPPQPEPELERKPESSLKKCGLTKDVTCAEQESVLHALLRQSAARPIQPLESPSPSHLVGGSELVGLISKEHAYSLPPSSSLLLGLPGTPFQVSPISGSTRLLHHHQTMYGNGIQTLHPSVGQEDRDEHNLTTPKSLKKHMVFRKFRNSRTFVQKDGSLEVTRQWKENYDFNLDSKFSTDSKHRAIIRALHGPWDFSMQDTNEELRLIVHMWIGLFYSRSTARLFHIESNFTHPCSEESDSLEISMGTVSAPAQSELKANSFAPLPVLTNTSDLSVESALDLSKKDISVVEQGSEILDLSLRNCNAEIVTSDPRVNRKETSVSREQKEASETLNLLKSPVGLHECHRKMVLSTEIINVVNDVRSTLLENIGCLEHTCVPSGKGDEIVIPVQEEIENVSVQPEDHGTGSGIGHMLHGSNNKKTEMKDCIEKSEDTEMSSVQKHEMDSSKSMTDKQVDHNKEAGDVVYTVEHDETESKDGEKLEVKENPYQESNIQPSPKVVHTGDDSTNKELGTVCNGNLLEDESLSATGEPKAVSPDQAENVNEDEDCCIGHEDKVIEDENRFEKENGLDEKNGCISAKEDGSDLSDQPVPMMCDSPDSIKENCITECNRQEPLDEQPPQADSTKDVCHDLELRKLCANGSALTDENAISDKAPNSPSGMDSIHNQPAVEANSETYICSVDKAHIKKAALLMSDESTFSLEGSYADGSIPQTKDNVETGKEDNWEVKENPYQEGNIEPSPKVMHTGDESTNKESGTVCNGNLLEDESQLATEEPKALSPGQAENINEDEDCCKGHDNEVIKDENCFEKENGLDEKDLCNSAKEDGSDLSDQPVPMICDSPDSIKEDGITECNRQEPLEEQPPQADSTENVCHDFEMRKLCANGSAMTDEHANSDKAPDTPSGMDPILSEPAVEANSETYICLVDKAHFKKAALTLSDESTCSLEGSYADESIPQTKDTVETGSQNEVMKNLSFGPSSEDHEDQDTKSIEREEKADSTTQKEPFRQQSPLPQCAVTQKCEAEVTLTDETDWNRDRSNEGLANIHSGVIIPFIGIDTSGEDTVEPHVSHPQVKVEEVVKGQREIPFITDTTFPKGILPIEVYSTSKVYSKEAELSAHKIPLLDVSETNQPMVLGSESDDRCPTPTMDEKPYKYIPCSGTSSTSAFSGSETRKNLTQKYLSRSSTPVKDEMPVEQKRCHTFTVNSDHNPPHGLHPDLELRTLRVLQSIDKFLSKRRHTDKSNQNETDVMKHSHDQTPNPSSKHIPTCFAPSHTAAKVTDNKIKNTKPAVVAASTSQELSAESSDHSLISPFKSKLEEVLGVRLQLKKTDSTVHQQYFEKVGKLQETSIGQDCHPYRSLPSTESLQAIKPNTDQDRHKITSQTQLTHEPRSYSQRPVMAVKPSKSDESQTDCIIEEQIENSSKNKLAKIPVVTFTTSTPMLLERKTESCKGYPERLNYDKQEASELFSKSSWISNVNDSKSNSDKAKLALQDLSYQYQGTGISKLINISSLSTSMQSFESAKSSSKLVGGNQHLLTYSSLEKVRQTTKENINMDQKACSNALASLMDYKDDSITDDSLVLGPQSSLACTIYNTSQERSYSFLEQLSQRCLQDDLTQASMEQECLIFSEQMKQLLKRSKGGPICQEDTHDKLKFPCVTPVTVHFSGLEEQGETVDHLDAPSLVGLKIMVDMSDRKSLADTTEEEKTLHLERMSQATSNPLEHAGVSGVTAECTTLYKAMMNNVCSGTKVLSRPKSYRMGRIHPKTEPSNHFDFCGQMKRKMDESFRSNLNSVVKKSCRTKYRFYILVTSDDAFFEETKAQLEAEGHTAVQPSEFFLGEDSSSSLLIILRNEDIAEHICEVPHLLELKKSPGVQFAGIDEPDDVVNLTHQELFTRGGFIVLDKAALEPLSLCNMKKMSEILQELSKTGKWKWMLHYRDSRRLKENARLSAEAKEKKHFLNWCQEAGLLEVLPYHECDLMSKDRPDYLSCLVRLQVQNVSARYLVFVTDTTTDDAFGRNGILTMTVNSFLTNSPSETFTV